MPLFDETFWTSEGRTLQQPDFFCLKQDAALYKSLLLQIRENISYDETGIWINHEESAKAKFNSFFNLAIDQHVDLAVTPEYSCPWDVIGQLIAEQRLPQRQRLWIAGCQSINARELTDFIAAHPDVVWVYERELVAQHINDREFFDPVCMVFKTLDAADQERLVIIIQFKNEFFGGAGFEWEQENMIRGTKFYVLSNLVASTKLIVQICSDALLNIDFTQIEHGRFSNSPLLLIHIQLNQSPFQTGYKNYRNSIFITGGKELNKEVLCLNWARGILDDEGAAWNTYGGSAIYIKSEKLNFSDTRFNSNHSLGLYYNNWHSHRSHIYFFGYNEHVYLLRNTKPSQQNANPAQMQRTGPELIGLYHWQEGWQPGPHADDGFATLCAELEESTGDISCISENTLHLDVERLIDLSLGSFVTAQDWSRPDKLSNIKILDDEINNRTNFTHDPSSLQSQARTEKLIRFGTLKNSILTNPVNLPSGLEDAELGYDQTIPANKRYVLNLHSRGNNLNKGTGIFLGYNTEAKAKEVRDRVINLLQESQQGKRVVVWYQTHAGIITLSPLPKPEVADNTGRKSNSFKKTRSS